MYLNWETNSSEALCLPQICHINVSTFFQLNIVANDYGNPPLNSSVNLYIRFYDPDSLPYFPEGQRQQQIQFTENTTGLLESNEIYQASYNYGEDEEDWDFDIYYVLLEGDEELFTVDVNDGTITLKEILDREEEDYYELKIVASNSESVPSNYDERSILVVEVEVTTKNNSEENVTQN